MTAIASRLRLAFRLFAPSEGGLLARRAYKGRTTRVAGPLLARRANKTHPSTPIALLLLAMLVSSCARPKPAVVPSVPPEVVVTEPEVKMVTEFEDFTGRTRASKVVDLKTQVTAELKELGFADGTDVAAGQLLFTLDATIFQAEVDRAGAALRQAEAGLQQSKAALRQAEAVATEAAKEDKLNKSATAGVSRLDLVKSEGAVKVAEAALKGSEASVTVAESAVTVAQKQLASAQNYVEYTRIKAPFAGRIGRRLVDAGNRVKQDDTVLARLVRLDPMDVDFDVDDRTSLRLHDLMMAGPNAAAAAAGGWRLLGRGRQHFNRTVLVGRPDRDDFTLEGAVTFVDNQFNTGTSTIQVRAEVTNPTGELVPGLFVRVRIPIGEPKMAVLVPEEAIGTDQQLKFVYVVNEKDEVEDRKVRLGQQEGSKRVVEPLPGDPKSGVRPTDRVIVAGVPRARVGAKVTVKTAGT